MWRVSQRFGVNALERSSDFLSKAAERNYNIFSLQLSGFVRVSAFSVRYQSGDKKANERWKMVYEGPLSRTVKLVKTFSLTTAAASLVGSPILVFFGKQSVPYVGKLAIAAVMCFGGCGTTALLHILTRSYIHKMYFDPDEKMFAAETVNLLCKRTRTEFSVEDIELNQQEKLFSTFKAQGRSYFLHQELVEGQQVLQYIQECKKSAVDMTHEDTAQIT